MYQSYIFTAGNYKAYRISKRDYKVVDTITGMEIRRCDCLACVGRVLKVLRRLDKR